MNNNYLFQTKEQIERAKLTVQQNMRKLMVEKLGKSEKEVEKIIEKAQKDSLPEKAGVPYSVTKRRDWSIYPLQIELVPRSAWYQNLRDALPPHQWDFIRKHAYKRAGYHCEICGGKGPNHPVEAHEEWDYDWKTRKQTLRKVTALCPACHLCKHPGFANVSGRLDEVIAQLKKVNQYSTELAKEHVADAFHDWSVMSMRKWDLDIDGLKKWLAVHCP